MRYNEWLGRFLGVVKNIIPEVVLFFVMYLINIAIFSLIATVSFWELAGFSNFWTSFRTNFFSSFGSFDF